MAGEKIHVIEPENLHRTVHVRRGKLLVAIAMLFGLLFAAAFIGTMIVPPREYYPVETYNVVIVRDAQGLRALGYEEADDFDRHLDDVAYTKAFKATVVIERAVPSPRAKRSWGSYNPNALQPSPDAIAKAGPEFGVSIELRGHGYVRKFGHDVPSDHTAWPRVAAEQDDALEKQIDPSFSSLFGTKLMDDATAREVLQVVATDVASQSGKDEYATPIRNGGADKPPLRAMNSPLFRNLAWIIPAGLTLLFSTLGSRSINRASASRPQASAQCFQ